jgi:hypothetical protein
MDTKISEFPTASTAVVSDILPIVSGGVNKGLSVGVLALNMPNLGNKGITKNVITQAMAATIPLTNTVIELPLRLNPYTLTNGASGQEVTLVSLDTNTVSVVSGWLSTILMSAGSSITLLFIGDTSKWVVKSYHNCTIS